MFGATPDWLCDGCLQMFPFLEKNCCPYCGAQLDDDVDDWHGASEWSAGGDSSRSSRRFVSPATSQQTQGKNHMLAGSVYPVCRHCPPHKMAFVKTVAAARYTGAAREMVHFLKFRQNRRLAVVMGRMMVERFACLQSGQDCVAAVSPRAGNSPVAFDLIVPVPLHKTRIRQRGYNQSALLAQALARGVGIPLREDLLVRERDTHVQSLLAKEERLTNPVGAFAVRAAIQQQHLLLVDDVLTTGATAGACAASLLAAGAASVTVMCFAR